MWSMEYIILLNEFSMHLFILDIDQLTRILVLCGTPTEETLNKITSEEVRAF